MSSSAAHKLPHRATVDDLLAIPEAERNHEIIAGVLVEKEASTGRHGGAQLDLGTLLNGAYGRRARGGHPGGWVFATEVEIELETHEVYKPDVVGWRRERLPRLPDKVPIRVRPDWVCEVLSKSTESKDRIDKHDTFERCGVPFYWLLDPQRETLKVQRLTAGGYLTVLVARAGQVVRAEPFLAIEIAVSDLFDDGDDSPAKEQS